MPINWEGAGGSTTKLDEIAYEATPGALITASEAWYEDPAGTLTKVYDTVPPRFARLHSFAKIPGGGWYILQDSNPANYFDGDSRDVIERQGWDPNAEGSDVVAEGMYHMSEAGSNVSGGRITGLPNRGPAGICVLPNGRLIWAASSGDLLSTDTTIFNQYTVSGGNAINHGRIDFYHNDPNRNNWHHRISGNELSQYYVHSMAAASNDIVYVSIGRATPPHSTYRYRSPVRDSRLIISSTAGMADALTRVLAIYYNDDGTERRRVVSGRTFVPHVELEGGGFRDAEPGEVVRSYQNDVGGVFLEVRYLGAFSGLGGGRLTLVAWSGDNYELDLAESQFGGEIILRLDLSQDPAGISTYWFARTQEGTYRFPQVTGVTTDGTDVWFAGNFSGIVAGGFQRNGAGRWGIWKRLSTGLAREPDAFSPYEQNVWLQDLHYVSPTKIWVLCERLRVGPAADGSLNRTHFVTSYNPTTEEFYDDDDFTFDI